VANARRGYSSKLSLDRIELGTWVNSLKVTCVAYDLLSKQVSAEPTNLVAFQGEKSTIEITPRLQHGRVAEWPDRDPMDEPSTLHRIQLASQQGCGGRPCFAEPPFGIADGALLKVAKNQSEAFLDFDLVGMFVEPGEHPEIRPVAAVLELIHRPVDQAALPRESSDSR